MLDQRTTTRGGSRQAGFLLVFLCLLLAAGCRISPERRVEVTRTVHQVRDETLSCPPERADRCAMASPLRELGAADTAHVALLQNPHDALLSRIHAIRAAQHSIELQTYIFVPDASGSLVLQELLTAARRGVKVRMLMDQLTAFDDADFLAGMATAHKNLEIKVYNPTLGKGQSNLLDIAGGLMCCFRELNHRMHNKVFVVDDRIGITGGRNYRNRYWGWDPEFNFLDRDVMVLGPTARKMRESFDEYWAHERAIHAEYLLDVSARILSGEVQPPSFALSEHPYAERLAQQAGDATLIQQRLVPLLLQADRVDFYADRPNKLFEKGNSREEDITLVLRGLIADAERSVVMQTPYLVFTRRATRLFKRLREEHPDIDLVVSTNSLASTDSFPVYAIDRKRRKPLVKNLKFHIYELRPNPGDLRDWAPISGGRAAAADLRQLEGFPIENGAERLSMHAKSLVLDSKVAIIGSHNFDPRSEDYNTEVVLVIHDPEVAQRLEAQILQATEPENAWVVARAPQVPVISFFSGIIGSISRRLPVLDIWPFRYTTCYDLIPGKEPLRPDHPDFQEHYRDVGEFPQVSLSLKQIQTELISAFGGFAKPFL